MSYRKVGDIEGGAGEAVWTTKEIAKWGVNFASRETKTFCWSEII